MPDVENSKDLISVLWSGADILRSKMDANEYKDYLLGIVFYKYLSDSFLIKVYDLIYDEKPENLKVALEAYKEALEDSSAEELKEKKIKRKYIALVSGVINHDIGEIDAPIGRDPSDRKKMCVTSTNSKDAITHFRVLERYKNASLIECELETGRTHQIRVHMKYINHPVINDPVYGKNNHGEFGQLLHAKEITFTHPTTKEVMTFSCEVPEEFNKILEEYKEE